MAITQLTRDSGINVSLVRMTSTDTLTEVIASGYLTAQQSNITEINGGEWIWLPSDMIVCFASDGHGIFSLTSDFSSVFFYSPPGAGTGTVTQVNTGTGLVGGPITGIGTVSLASIGSNSFLANTTGGSAPPISTSLSAFLLAANNLSDVSNTATSRMNLGLKIGTDVEAWSVKLDSLTAAATNLGAIVYSTPNAYALLNATATANQVMLSGSNAAPSWSVATYPSSIPINQILYASAINTITGISTANNSVLATGISGIPFFTTSLPNAVQVSINSLNAGTGASITTFWRGDGTWASPAGGGSGTVSAGTINQLAFYAATGTTVSGLATANNSVLATNGSGVPAFTTSLPSAVQIGVNSLNAGTGATNSTFWRGDGTWASPSGSGTVNAGTINQLAFYSATGTAVSGLATSASGVLVTSAGSVPSISTTLPAGLTIPGYAQSGANNDITSMNGLTGALQAPLAIQDSAGNDILVFNYQSTPVNFFSIANSISGDPVTFLATGSDPTVAMNLVSKGGGFNLSDSTNTFGGSLTFKDQTDTFGTSLTVSPTQAVNLNLTLPSVDGNPGQYLGTDGLGNLSFINGNAINAANVQTFDVAGSFTYTYTPGTKFLVVEAAGGSGAGAGSTGGVGTVSAGGGGGAGGFARRLLSIADIGASVPVTVGAAGIGVTGAAGGDGGDSSFDVLVVATGGTGGQVGSPSTTQSYGVPGNSGVGTVGDILSFGGPAAAGFGVGSALLAIGGSGGVGFFGGGGTQTTGESNGNASTSFAAGGGGASSLTIDHTGGSGASGMIIITEFLSI